MIRSIKIISSQKDLQAVAKKLGVRPDWHEPDEQAVTVVVSGKSFDNAGFWGLDYEISENKRKAERKKEYGRAWTCVEKYVVIKQNGKPVAEVNLASLFAMACGNPMED